MQQWALKKVAGAQQLSKAMALAAEAIAELPQESITVIRAAAVPLPSQLFLSLHLLLIP